MRIKMLIAYDGRGYLGWQSNKAAESFEKNRFIQDIVNEVLTKVFDEKTEVRASGRTDAGVHAMAQCIDFSVSTKKYKEAVTKLKASEAGKADSAGCSEETEEADIIRKSCNSLLPSDIAVTAVEFPEEKFHSRYDAVSKTYIYRIDIRDRQSVFSRGYAYPAGEKPDVKKMREAAQYLVGTHDFSAFCTVRASDRKRLRTEESADAVMKENVGTEEMHGKKHGNIRTIYSIRIEEKQCLNTPEIHIYITGDGFLYNMVRIIAGTLLEAGLLKREPESIKKALLTGKRADAGEKLWPDGLYLAEVSYRK